MTDLDTIDAAGDRAREEALAALRKTWETDATAPLREELTTAAAQLAHRTAALAVETARAEGLLAEKRSLEQLVADLRAQLATQPPATPVKVSPGLWFERSSAPHRVEVWAHKFTPYVRHLSMAKTRDTTAYATAYLNPDGEGGKHRPTLGYMDDAPLFAVPTEATFEKQLVADAKFDILTAQRHGITGFVMDILGWQFNGSPHYARAAAHAQAADELGGTFKIIPMIDGNGSTAAAGPERTAEAIAFFCNRPSSYKRDGYDIYSSFKGEQQTPIFWAQVADILRTRHKLNPGWIGGFLNFNRAGDYAHLTIGEGSWGGGDDPQVIRNVSNEVAQTRTRGKLSMLAVGTQAVRRSVDHGSWFDEAANTEAQRAYFEKAIAEKPDIIQLVTYDDFSEGNTYAPSEARGYGPLALAAWYLEKLQHGQFPEIRQQEIILSHRVAPIGAAPKTVAARALVQNGNRKRPLTPLRDTVEVLTFLPVPTKVTVTIGGKANMYDAPAGMHARLFPLAPGEIKAATAEGLNITSPVVVVAQPVRTSPQYIWAVATHGTAGQRAPYGP